MEQNAQFCGLDKRQLTALRSYWNKQSLAKTSDWAYFDEFAAWCVQQGERKPYSGLLKRDESKPHGPDNSYWGKAKRKKYDTGLEAGQCDDGSPCMDCDLKSRCRKPCARRYAYWDERMAVVRRQFGVATEVATEIATGEEVTQE